MRKILKFLHTLGACGMIGALAGYAVLLVAAPQDSAQAYADMRQSISALCNYILVPSLAVTLVSGVFAMAHHHPFHEMRWVWLKAALGLAMFEGTLGMIGSKADAAARIATAVADGESSETALQSAIANEWYALAVISFLTVANVVLGVWRPSMKRRARKPVVS